MSDTLRFIAGRSLQGIEPVVIDGEFAIEADARLRRGLTAGCGPAAATLFAEPVLTRGNGSAPARVDWYSVHTGPVRALADLEAAEADRLRSRARAVLATLRSVADDDDLGPLLAGALNLASPNSLLAVGREPVLVDWGLLPGAVLHDELARTAHVRLTLNELGGDGGVRPAISRAEWAAGRRDRADRPTVAPLRPWEIASRDEGAARGPWIAAGIAAAVLALSFVPGVLAFPSAPAGAGEAPLDTALLKGLKQRRDQLDAAAAQDCPALQDALPRLVPADPRRVRAEGGDPPQAQVGPTGAIPAAGESLADGGGSGSTSASDDLAARLGEATVLVIAGESAGSGFFVTTNLIVTNRHVIEGASRIRVAGQLVGVVPAEAVQIGGDTPFEDLALLRVPDQPVVRPLALAEPAPSLTPVVASGFPGLHLGTDPAFARLRNGDATAARALEPVLLTGVVNHLQRFEEHGATLVLHGAEISSGNSGGPLIDYCGRVIGVNIFGRVGTVLPATARYALGSDKLVRFLREGRRAVDLDVRPCTIEPSRTASAPALPSTPAVAPSATPQPSRVP